MPNAAANTIYGIQEIADALGVTPRALRFYEEKGLIAPQRVGSTRVYTRREFARMQLILRGKRLGFTIREIREFLDLYDVDAGHVEQSRHLIGQVRHRIAALHKQRHAIDETIAELEQIENEALDRIASR